MVTRDTCNVHIPFESGQVLRVYGRVLELEYIGSLDGSA